MFAKLPVVAMILPQAVTHQAGELPPLGEYILPRVFDVVKELDNITLSVAQVVVDIACAGTHLVNYRNKVARCIVRETLLDAVLPLPVTMYISTEPL